MSCLHDYREEIDGPQSRIEVGNRRILCKGAKGGDGGAASTGTPNSGGSGGTGGNGGIGLGMASALAQAGKDAWPSKPIRLVVPYQAGGATSSALPAFHSAAVTPASRCASPMAISTPGFPTRAGRTRSARWRGHSISSRRP